MKHRRVPNTISKRFRRKLEENLARHQRLLDLLQDDQQ